MGKKIKCSVAEQLMKERLRLIMKEQAGMVIGNYQMDVKDKRIQMEVIAKVMDVLKREHLVDETKISSKDYYTSEDER